METKTRYRPNSEVKPGIGAGEAKAGGWVGSENPSGEVTDGKGRRPKESHG